MQDCSGFFQFFCQFAVSCSGFVQNIFCQACRALYDKPGNVVFLRQFCKNGKFSFIVVFIQENVDRMNLNVVFCKQRHCLLQILRDPETVVPGINTESETRLDLAYMIFVPMLHYLQNKNSFSGNEDGMRYLITPGKRSVPDPDGCEEAKKEEAILTVDLWPEPWTLDKTDPALRRREIFPMTEEGRTAVAQYLNDAYNAEPERWSAHPSILDCEPWTPPAPEPDAETQH